jgi:hypothetical protein
VIALAVCLAACGGGDDDDESYPIGGRVTGLTAPGLTLSNNGGSLLQVTAGSTSFTFADRYWQGSRFDVTVASQPAGLICTVTNGAGTIRGAVTEIAVACEAETYIVAGSVTGLSTAGLVLQINGTSDLSIAANSSSFQFATPLAVGSGFNVTVASQPSGLICTVTNGAGTIHGAVTQIAVACNAETHTVAGSITGLGTAGLVLQMNGADDLSIAPNSSSFEFPTPIAAGSGYHVTLLSQPAGLACTINNASGAHINADVSNVQVVCSATALTVGGSIGGLGGAGLVLQNNGADDLAVAANASSFRFATPVAQNGTFDVTILTQPAGQTCSVLNGAGVAQTNITNIAVTCANIPTYSVVAGAGLSGSISPSGVLVVNQGGNIGFVATPEPGYFIDEWLVNGVPVQWGGSIYSLSNVAANLTVHVKFGAASLTSSVSRLALSVNDVTTHPALTGSSRSIVITNQAATTTARNLVITPSGFPSGTSISATTCGSRLEPGSSCTITLTPGSVATSGCTSGSAPVPGTVTVNSDNGPALTVEVLVLGYGCLYQGGYLFAIDDTTPPTSSIGGKVAAQSDQSTGVIWSAAIGSTSVDYTDLGLHEDSITPCSASYDGACNSTVILSHYSPAWLYQRSRFAAGQCAATISGYSDWYLPALCELDSCPGGGGQSIRGNVGAVAGLAFNTYWTSTEFHITPANLAYSVNISFGMDHNTDKNTSLRVRCARAVSH